MEERRKDYMDLTEVKSDIKTILVRQAEIKTQVEKTNGRVSQLEKFMWTVLGCATTFGIFELNRFLQVLGHQ